MWRDDAYMLDMLLAGRKVQNYTRNVGWEKFRDDDLLQNAVMHQIQIIGEAARKVSLQYQQEHPQIPCRQLLVCETALFMNILILFLKGYGRLSRPVYLN
jgi:uncharacterized protein with HEPN domain